MALQQVYGSPTYYSLAGQVHVRDTNFEPKLVIIVSSTHARELILTYEMWMILPLVTKAPFLMVFAQSTIVKDRQTDRQTYRIGSHATLTFCLIAKSIEKKQKLH